MKRAVRRRFFSAFRVDAPSQMVVGGGTVKTQLPALVKSVGMKNPLIVTDPFMVQIGQAGKIADILRENGYGVGIFSETVPDPTTVEVDIGVEKFKSGGHDGVIALGGGSPIDTAKGIVTLTTNAGPFRKYKAPNVVPNPCPPLIAIPTTAGTGSEVTKVTVITDVETGEKMMCSSPYLTPTAALVDYELSMTCPRRLTADNAIDSLTHAIEAYVSKKQNPYSDCLALKSMNTISRYLRIACKEPSNVEAREALMFAATQAGLAFSNSSVALVHGMSRPLGVHFKIPHGMSNAMLLPAITEFSICAAEKRYADCARAMDLVSSSVSDSGACDALLSELQALNDDLDVPTVKDFGADYTKYSSLLDLMSEQALASGSPGNNPRVPTHEELWNLYSIVYDTKKIK